MRKLEKFLKEKGIFFYPSQTNFLLLKVPNPESLMENLKSKGTLVRPREGPNIEGTIRVSIGTLGDTERFIKAFSKLLRA